MKKSLIALAALATVATAAQAQSSVTIYGIVDAGLVMSKGVDGTGTTNQSLTSLASGPLSTSRWGFKGTEDLGGGLSASFVLESQIAADTGVGGSSTTLFNRASTVGLTQNGIGSLTLGRMNRLDYDAAIAVDAFGAANFGGAVNVAHGGSDIDGTDARVSQGIKLTSASLNGLTLSAQVALGEVPGVNSGSRQVAYMADYAQGNLRATYAYSKLNDAAGAKSEDRYVAGVSYNFGPVKPFVGVMEKEGVGQTEKVKASFVGVQVPVNAKVTVMAHYTKVDNMAYVATKDADVYALGVTYALSKRTTAYLMTGRSNNDGQANLGVTTLGGTVSAGQDQTATAVGIRHTF